MKFSVIFFVGSVCILLLVQCATSQLCPQCICRSSYSPVCAMNKDTKKLRGFSSQCVFNCTNKCRDDKFVYVGPGRCGQYPSNTAATAAPAPAAAATTVTTGQETVVTTPIPYTTLYNHQV